MHHILSRALFLIPLALTPSTAPRAEEFDRIYEEAGKQFAYSLASTGMNYSFEFQTNPGSEESRLRAVQHIFRVLYQDDSIPPKASDQYMSEGAKCRVFDGIFYTYRTCFLPNAYSPEHRDRFWGFVSQSPNFNWFLTRQLLPGALVVGGLVLYFRRRKA
jgi:hypothetical protein